MLSGGERGTPTGLDVCAFRLSKPPPMPFSLSIATFAAAEAIDADVAGQAAIAAAPRMLAARDSAAAAAVAAAIGRGITERMMPSDEERTGSGGGLLAERKLRDTPVGPP